MTTVINLVYASANKIWYTYSTDGGSASTPSIAASGGNNYQLNQNYPNPFNPETAISYQLSTDSYVTLKVYDILGNLVSTLVNEYQTKGTYNVNFNASGLASGIYWPLLNPSQKGGF